MSQQPEKVKPLPEYRCCVCHGGPSLALGAFQFAGRAIMETYQTSNPWVHRLCIPTYTRRRMDAAFHRGEGVRP